MGLVDHWIIRVRKDKSEKWQTFYTTSKNKIQNYKDAEYKVRHVANFQAVMRYMDLSPLPEVEFFVPVKEEESELLDPLTA